MSSPFQSATPAEIETPVEEVPQGPQSPHQKLIDQVTELIMTMKQFPEENKSKFLWKFVCNYITLLENNRHYLLPLLEKAYPGKVGVTDELVSALISIKKPSGVVDFITTLNSIPEENLTPDEKNVLGIIKLNTPQGPFLDALISVIQQLPPEEQKEMDAQFKEEINKEKYSGKAEVVPKKTSVPFMERMIPGTSFKVLWAIILIVLLLVVGGAAYYFFVVKRSEGPRQLNFRSGGESDVSE